MKYLLKIESFNSIPDIEITADKYKKLEIAQRILVNAQAIEIKYDILIANYLDFEKQILNNTVTIMVRNVSEYLNLFEIRQSLNIRLVNLLTSAKLYRDQLIQNVCKCVPEIQNIKNSIEDLFKKESETNLEYRFMELLRDHVQHKGLPVRWTQHNMSRVPITVDGLLEYNLQFGLELSQLKEDRMFKKSRLGKLGENINLKSTTRLYIESLSNIHESVREFIANSVSEARKLIEDTHNRYPNSSSRNLSTLRACKLTNKGQLTAIPLLLEWDNVRLELQKTNKKLTNLSKRYVSGKIKFKS